MKYSLEKDLCDDFIYFIKKSSWKVYAEQNNWDMIIVRGKIQVGVQAKLIANNKVLIQTLPKLPYTGIGPTYRIALIAGFTGRTPRARFETRKIFYSMARHFRVIVIDMSCRNKLMTGWDWNLGYKGGKRNLNLKHYNWRPSELEWVPPFIPNFPAGVPSPKHVSKWNLSMLDLRELELERGWICLEDCRNIIKKYNSKFHASSLLTTYWFCTNEKIEGSRQCKWTLKYGYLDPMIIFESISNMRNA